MVGGLDLVFKLASPALAAAVGLFSQERSESPVPLKSDVPTGPGIPSLGAAISGQGKTGLPEEPMAAKSIPARDMSSLDRLLPKEGIPDNTPLKEKAETISKSREAMGFSPDTQYYGLHFSSYRKREKAVAGIQFQKNKFKNLLEGKNFTIQKADLGPKKGIW